MSLEQEGLVDPSNMLTLMRSRRVVRDFSPEPVDEAHLWMILEAGRWATSASNNRVHRCLVVRNPQRIKLVADMSPGIYSLPGAMIVICTDLGAVAKAQLRLGNEPSMWIDAGTLMMNMMVQAHALGIGTCPVTSFSQSGVEVVLALPAHARPDLILQVGHRRTGAAKPLKRKAASNSRQSAGLTYWEEYAREYPGA